MPAGEYRRSLKHPEAEELFDLWIYRPLAWLFVRAVYRTPLTPNQVTMLSLAAALAAAYCFASGTMALLAVGAAWYAAANILDCADGQLARLQGSGTPNGRLWDGVADYIGTTAIFLGIGTGSTLLGMNLWVEVIAAGLSSALHAMIFDHVQGDFLARARGERTAGVRPIPVPAAGGPFGTLYGVYTGAQSRVMEAIVPGGEASSIGPERDAALMRLWSFLGPTTNRTALIALALVGRIDLFLWAVIVPGNLWLLAMIWFQRRSAAADMAGAADPSAVPADSSDTTGA
jgi:phosphatidylglycerophosphate synthase